MEFTDFCPASRFTPSLTLAVFFSKSNGPTKPFWMLYLLIPALSNNDSPAPQAFPAVTTGIAGAVAGERGINGLSSIVIQTPEIPVEIPSERPKWPFKKNPPVIPGGWRGSLDGRGGNVLRCLATESDTATQLGQLR